MSDEKTGPFKDRTTMEHPSFVTVSFSRVTGGNKKFFGSSVRSNSWIVLRIQKAVLHHDLGYDSIHGSMDAMIEVGLSPAQFAELLTTMNVGTGVPGTLQRYNGESIEQLNDADSETKRVREHYERVLRARNAEARAEIKAIEAVMDEKKTLTQELKGRIKGVLERLTVQSDNSMPFYIDQFQEATEKVMVQAKAEVDAFVTHAIHSTGLEALRSQIPTPAIDHTCKHGTPIDDCSQGCFDAREGEVK